MSGYLDSYTTKQGQKLWILGFVGTVKEVEEAIQFCDGLPNTTYKIGRLRIIDSKTEQHLEVRTHDLQEALLLKLRYHSGK